jgi:GcrA cell cycle regulator
MSWTDEKIELLKRLYADGLSASQISAEIPGMSRNAVIGKIHRLKLGGRPARPPKARRRHKSGPAIQANLDAKKIDRDPLEHLEVPQGPRVSIIELNETTCRWPIGEVCSEDFGYCGALPKAGKIYCPYHQRIATESHAQRTSRMKDTEEDRRSVRKTWAGFS